METINVNYKKYLPTTKIDQEISPEIFQNTESEFNQSFIPLFLIQFDLSTLLMEEFNI